MPPTLTWFSFEHQDDAVIEERFGLPVNKKIICPACDEYQSMAGTIAHLNNNKSENSFYDTHPNHGWTFKEIGMWLREIGY